MVAAAGLLLTACPAQERNPTTTTIARNSSGDPIAEGEVYTESLNFDEPRTIRYGPVELTLLSGEITNVDAETGEPVPPGDQWFATIEAEVTKLIAVDFPVSGSSADLLLADGRGARNRATSGVEGEVGERLAKQFLFIVPPGTGWDGTSFRFGRSSDVRSVTPLTGQLPAAELPKWIEPGASGAAGQLSLLVLSAQVTLDDSAGNRAERNTKFLELSLQLVNDGDDQIPVTAEFFRFATDDALLDPVSAPALGLAPRSTVVIVATFAVPTEVTGGELLVRDPAAGSSAVNIGFDLSGGQPSEEPFDEPTPLDPAAESTTTTTTESTTTTEPTDTTQTTASSETTETVEAPETTETTAGS